VIGDFGWRKRAFRIADGGRNDKDGQELSNVVKRWSNDGK